MKTPKMEALETCSDKPAKPSNPSEMLCRLAQDITLFKYGEVTSVHIVVETRDRKPTILSGGSDAQRDPSLAMWEAIKELHRISDPPCQLVSGEPVFEPIKE